MKAYERLLNYVKIPTMSDEFSGTHPSSEKQFTLARMLAEEMRSIGLTDVRLDPYCYLYGKLPASEGYEALPTIGFIAHMDTSPDFSDTTVKPVIVENYNGEELTLGTSGRTLSPKSFPHLASLKGRSLIVTDGTTLLGADDKAGIAEILTMIERIVTEKIPHCPLAVAFTPDEEIGEGADHFDVAGFGASFAYTVDGGEEGSLEYENFNAAGAYFTVNGVNVHPGSAKDVMKNASLIAMEIDGMLPKGERPVDTEGYEGFYHLTDMEGTCERAVLRYIVRDHSSEKFEERIATVRRIARQINERYGEGTVSLEVKQQYRNMAEMIAPHPHLIENAKRAAELAGVTPKTEPIRGGTDGARLSFMGLPCPNLGTGSYAFHGPYEHTTIEGMELATTILTELVKLYSQI